MAYPYPPFAYSYPPRPKRGVDSLTVTVLVLSCIAILIGLGCTALTFVFAFTPENIPARTYFAGIVGLGSFCVSGLVGGSFGLYHSIMALNHKKSVRLKMPPFWTFLLLYIVVLGVAALLSSIHMAVTYPALTVLLIALAAIFPAFVFVSLGVRRLRIDLRRWQTTWRRFAIALISGATMGIFLASLAELGLQLLLIEKMHITAATAHCIDNPDGTGCQTPQSLFILFMLVSVIAPLVEETVKPLGVAMLIRRVNGPREAFTLGMAAGIGFNLIETVGYMSSQYGDWLNVALLRSASGLLHGFGAAMVALGWYYLAHKEERNHVRRGIACWCYAVVQHAIWNGSFGLAFLPGPIGSFFSNGTLDLGVIRLDAIDIVYAIEVLIMLFIFLYVTRRLNRENSSPEKPSDKQPVGTNPGLAAS